MRARTAVMLLAAVLAAGCGDDGDDAGGPADSSTTSASTEDGSTVDTAADQQAAEKALLVLSDLPAGWVQDTDDDADDDRDDADAAAEAVLAECLELDPAFVETDETDGEPTADSAFESPESFSVSSDVQVNLTASEGEDVMAALTGGDGATCLQQAFEASADASDVEVGEVTVEVLPFEPLGDQTAAFRATIPFETDDGTVLFVTDTILVTKGRAVVSMDFTTLSEPWDDAEAQRLTELVLDRIPSDL